MKCIKLKIGVPNLSNEEMLKELLNHVGKLFLCPPQKQANTQPTF